MSRSATEPRSEREQVARKQAAGSVLKAFDVVEALAAARGPLALQDLARAVSLPPSTVHRLARSLELRGYVERVPGGYRLTLRLFELGNAIAADIDVVAEARPVCRRLCEDVGETVNLAVRSGGSIVYLIKEESPRSVRLVSQIGAHAPLACTAMGKVLLAYAPCGERDRLVAAAELVARTESTITDRARLSRELEAVRARGWAVDDEEFDYGLVCLAAPVFGRDGEVTAAMSVSGPAQRLPRPAWPAVAERVREAALDVSRRIGAAP